MPHLPSSRAGHRRNATPRAYHRRRPQSSRRPLQSFRHRHRAPRARLPHHQSLFRPVTDVSTSSDDLDAQEPESDENLLTSTDTEDARTAAASENETRQSRAYFITLRKVGCGPFYHCQIESRSVASSGERLLRSEPEDALVLDQTTTSVSFALVDGDPIAAAKRVYNRLISSQGFVDADIMMKVLDGFLERFLLGEYGYEVDSTPTFQRHPYYLRRSYPLRHVDSAQNSREDDSIRAGNAFSIIHL
ncbi:uncharacterized protein NECHADRAFT_85165 [Fusarium vanettenii 77-13-4]|uniref:Uncharacterized protein n=1 Tax=Fusarium vanettenii (strain ATCC MYA-4622 / CBS 123669 / FGSC 9596 / NRRL 45880 / 77-13-4) TaxID=660122 RepID=C7YV63_FUSV7|nr:uncharacterized protein NECHADRAFT_85165 [Fusarium vanettenii 77-13-4]EEU44930.1 predicted protein [Fusarium vanettenii 77-13-4]